MVSSISSGNDYLTTLLSKLASSTIGSTKDSDSDAKKAGSLSASDLFSKLTNDLGGDGKTITKSELESYIKKVESDNSGSEDKRKLGLLKQLDANWDKISGGSDSITESQLESGMSYLQPPAPPTGGAGSMATDLYSSLADAVGSTDGSISLDDLTKYLKNLISELEDSTSSSGTTSSTSTTTSTTDTSTSTSSTSSNNNTAALQKEIKFISELVSNFDSFSNGSTSITSNSFYNALKEPQDPSTVTSDQLVSPIDLRV